MKNFLFLTLLIIVSCTATKEQLASPTPKAFAQKEQLAPTHDDKEVPLHKKELVETITKQLIEARGDKGHKEPNIKVETSDCCGAWMTKQEVGLEEKAYDLCIGLGKDSINCIAALMGHEISHYYQNHDVEENFGFKYLNKEFNRAEKELVKNSTRAKQEAEADYLGGFLAYTAGYAPFGILEELLPQLYRSYDLPDPMPGYPPLRERIKNAQASNQKTLELASVFDMANQLVLLEEYEAAIEYYNYILEKDYTSREIHNNIGVCYFMQALEGWYIPIKYAYPIELDGEGRLLNGAKGNDELNLQAQKLLDRAKENFDRAYILDETFATAKLNLACAYSLEENQRKAKYELENAIEIATDQKQNKVLTDCIILEGILYVQEGTKEKATEKFEQATKQGSLLAKYNQDILTTGRAEYTGKQINYEDLPSNEKERIAGQDIDVLRAVNFDQQVTVNENANLKIKQDAISQLLLHIGARKEGKKKRRQIVLHQTLPSYTGKTLKGIALNSTQQQVIEQYGPPDRIMSQKKREVLIYKTPKLIFTLLDGHVHSWSIYRIKN